MKSIKSIDYGMVLLASLKPTYQTSTYFDVREIAHTHKLPASFLEKLAQRFKQAGLLTSRRGMGGGYQLAVHPKTISIENIIAVLEDKTQYCPVLRKKQ